MNTEEYIASGILELYVLGSLTDAEAREVEKLMALHPEIKNEVFSIQAAMEKYAISGAREVSTDVKNKIFNKIRNDRNNQEAVTGSPAAERISYGRFPYYIAAASVAIAILSLFASYVFYSRWQSSENKLKVLAAEKEELSNNFNLTRQTFNSKIALAEDHLRILQDTQSVIVTLKGLPKAPDAKLKVIWNEHSGKVLVFVNNLPPAPAGKQYQLWALENGKPVDGGVFDVTDRLQTVKNIKNAQAFAVTLEVAGGSAVPTLSEMYLLGEI